MRKMMDLIAGPGSHKDELLLNYIRKNILTKNYVTNLCFICGQGEECEHHTQPSAKELRKLMFETNSRDTVYFLKSFFFGTDRQNYLQLIEDACNANIRIYKTDQAKEHVTDDKRWTDMYCNFVSPEDIEI